MTMPSETTAALPAAAKLVPVSLLTVCGLEELGHHSARGVTHVLSILDPDKPDPEDFGAYGAHHRTLLRFHDAIEPGEGIVLPEPSDVDEILAFGRSVLAEEDRPEGGHVLIHCHAGVSRSTAAMAMLLALSYPEEDEDSLMDRLFAVRDKAWPNSRMIAFADERLERDGRLIEAVRRLHARQLQLRPNIAEFMRANARGREVDEALAARPRPAQGAPPRR